MIQTALFSILILLQGCCATRYQIEDCSQELNSINIIDHNGISETIGQSERLKQYNNVDFSKPQPYQKVLRVYGRDLEGNVRAVITSYHPNGQLKQHLEVLNNRAFGTYQEYHPNGLLKLEAFVIGGNADLSTASESTWLFDGKSRAWDDESHLLAEIEYSKGKLEGVSLYYHPNGKLWKRLPYKKGSRDGVQEVFLDDGALLQTIGYADGTRHGASVRYWNGEQAAAQETYCEGRLIDGDYYERCGKCVSQVRKGEGVRAIFGRNTIVEMDEYKNGFQEGTVKVFGKNNRLVRTYSIKNDVKHGEETEYFDTQERNTNPRPKLSIAWYEGKIQGLVKTWYDNGIQESQKEMSNNIKNGVLTAWYKNGSLMLIEEYDHNTLFRGEYYRKNDKIPVSQISQGKGTATMFDSEGNFIRKIEYVNGKPAD